MVSPALYNWRDVVCVDHLLHPFTCKKEGRDDVSTADKKIRVIAVSVLIALGISLIGLSYSPLFMLGIFTIACPLLFYVHAATVKSKAVSVLNRPQGSGGDIA